MEAVFLEVFNMSIVAGWVALAVAAVRLLLRKAPKAISVLLWVPVGLRLVCPFSFESVLSLIPSAETLPSGILYASSPAIKSGIPALNSGINPVLSASLSPNPGDSVNPMQVIAFIAAAVWIIGMAAMLVYTAVSYALIKRKVRISAPFEGNVFLCDSISSPFILGIIRPKIYVPSSIDSTDLQYVIAHEKAHLKRRDHWWKPLGFLLLTVYWFNPVLWVAYILLCRDIELACDEKVIKEQGEAIKKEYSTALINCSLPRKSVAACPLAFGETGIKSRIKSVLSYKKPAFWVVAAAVVLSVALAVCFLTNPKQEESIFNAKYETAQCLYNAVVSEEKETRLNSVIYSINSSGDVYKDYGNSAQEYIGTLTETDFSVSELNSLIADSGGKGVLIGKIEAAYEIINSQGGREYAFLQTANGEFFAVSFFTNGSVMDVFSLVKVFSPVKVQPSAEGTQNKTLTLDDVVALSKKGQSLDWSDFEKFVYIETGSGLYIRRYEIDSMFTLSIGGTSPDEDAWYFYLHASDESDTMIDIRENDVQSFIDEHKNNPVVTRLSASWHCCPVGYNENTLATMYEYGGIPKGTAYNKLKTLAAVKIESTQQLEQFKEKMSSVADFDRSYPDTPSFNSVSSEYSADFFTDSALLAVYISSPDTSRRHTVEFISKSQGVISAGISEIDYESGDTAMEGWLILIRIDKSELQAAKEIRSFVNSTQFPNRGTADAQLVRAYVFRDSEQPIKPSIALYDNGVFTFNFSAVSSYIGMGRYTIEGDTLTLNTDDGNFTYVFDMVAKEEGEPKISTVDGEKKLVFDAKKSSEQLWFSDMHDGCEFF